MARGSPPPQGAQRMEVRMALTFLERFRLGPPGAPPVFDGPAQVRAYWEGLRQDGRLPARADLDPRGLVGVLDRVLLADRIGRGVAQVRIAGSGLAEFAGLDLRVVALGKFEPGFNICRLG